MHCSRVTSGAHVARHGSADSWHHLLPHPCDHPWAAGHGECHSGWCKCHDGWFGHDCAYRTNTTEWTPGGCRLLAWRQACCCCRLACCCRELCRQSLAHTHAFRPQAAHGPKHAAGLCPAVPAHCCCSTRFQQPHTPGCRHGGWRAALAEAPCTHARRQGPRAWCHPQAPAHLHVSTAARSGWYCCQPCSQPAAALRNCMGLSAAAERPCPVCVRCPASWSQYAPGH